MSFVQRLSRQSDIVARVVLLVVLLVALAPALPAAAQDPAPAGVVPTELKKLLAGAGVADDCFGRSVAVDGDAIVVGDPCVTVDGKPYQGATYVFGRDQGGANQWGQVAKLNASDGAIGDAFGLSVAIDGDTIVVGAIFAVVDGRQKQGAAYVFKRDQGGASTWGQVAKLIASDGAADDEFGGSVAVSGDTLVVAVYGATVDGKTSQGTAYVFGRDQGGANAWGQVKKLTAGDGAAYDNFGRSVAVDGDTIVVGAPFATVGGQQLQGAAYVFGRDRGGANAWGQVQKLTAGDGVARYLFGISVAISGDAIVVGASWVTVGGQGHQGAAYVFGRDQGGANQWGQTQKLTASDGAINDYFGNRVAIDGDTIVVVATFADVDGKQDQGAAYVFKRDHGGTNRWSQVAKLIASDGAAYDEFGGSVAVSGDIIVAGTPLADVGNNADLGAAYVFFNPYELRINCGGPRYVDKAGNLWQADRPWPSLVWTPYWGYLGGAARSVTYPIANTEDDKLYQTERLWIGQAKPGYRFVVPNGRYRLTFKYAETFWNAGGKRRFTVMAEGKICFANYDPFFAAGGKAKAAPDKSCTVTVTDGLLDISFISVLGQAKADAIAIRQLAQ
jgi:hypothetical protein